ncbi:hypothetical protein F2Q68_00012288 [Brassica cretica]|uniref:Uncharacterized protein n=1 Tax=Brassica cretica TaxID=69181 RepID=A0A8S9KPD6_BRACR|nr:hypothetical protein F2Q68_00012288 [Brassica cretica]
MQSQLCRLFLSIFSDCSFGCSYEPDTSLSSCLSSTSFIDQESTQLDDELSWFLYWNPLINQTLSLSVDSLSLKDSIDDAFLKLPDPDVCFCTPHEALSESVPV